MNQLVLWMMSAEHFNYLYITCEDFSCKCIFSLIVHEHIVNLVKHLELYVKFP